MQAQDAQLEAALRLHLAGHTAQAEAAYRAIIASRPQHAQARHYLGFLLQQRGNLPEALMHLSQAVALDGNNAESHFNMGIVLTRQGDAQAAIAAFRRALDLDAEKYFYWTNLGAALETACALAQAEQCYVRAIALDAQCPDAYFLLSALCVKQQRFAEARQYNHRGIVAAPQAHSRMLLGQAYHELGRVEEAIALFEDWLRAEPDNAVAAHLLSAYRGGQAPAQCSPAYVEQTFDAFAPTFDNVLGRLKYCGPQQVQDYLSGLGLTHASLSVLDLGCGTGLVGSVVRPYARELVGVDLSQAMLDRAAARQCYSRLHKAELTDYLQGSDARFDLIVCMDTFVYLGRLDAVLELVGQRLQPGGHLLFSTEKLLAPGDYHLNISGRYSHHPDYLAVALNAAGLHVVQVSEVPIRMESGCPIMGQFVCARR